MWPCRTMTIHFEGLCFYEDAASRCHPVSQMSRQGELVRQVLILVRLDRHPNAERKDDRPARRDERAKWRSHVWGLANDAFNELWKLGQNPGVARQIANWIIRQADSRGFFSVGMTVFRDHPDMLKKSSFRYSSGQTRIVLIM